MDGLTSEEKIPEMEQDDNSTIFNNIKKKQELVKKIRSMSKSELIEIFKIIKENTDKYTENNNGIFINLTSINDNTFQKLLDFVNFSSLNLSNLNEIQEKREKDMEMILYSEIENNTKENELNNEKKNLDEIDKEKTSEKKKKKIKKENIIDDIILSDIKDIKNLLNKKNLKFSGNKAKILRKCKEISRNKPKIVYEYKNKNTNTIDNSEIIENNDNEDEDSFKDDEDNVEIKDDKDDITNIDDDEETADDDIDDDYKDEYKDDDEEKYDDKDENSILLDDDNDSELEIDII